MLRLHCTDMANDAEGLLDLFSSKGSEVKALGVEEDPSGSEFAVAEAPEGEVDELAKEAEDMGFGNIAFEPGKKGKEILRFGKD